MSPEIIPAPSPAEVDKKAAIKAWHDAKNDADRVAAVTQFPVLAEIYSLAATLKPKS